jgi:hypothetical protein
MDATDQVVLYRSDVGVLAWNVSKKNKLVEIERTTLSYNCIHVRPNQ